MLERFFQFKAKKTDLRTEVLAGVTTFLTMAYIIFVNPNILSETGMDRDALVVVTCLVAAFSTILMGLIPRVPLALAPGMGLNAFFTYTLVIGQGIHWQVALGMVFWAGVLFLLLSLLGGREKLLAAIPDALIAAIAAGIGMFLLFIGFKNLGLIQAHPETLVALGAFTPEVLIGLAGLLLTILLIIRRVKGALLIGIGAATLLALLLGKVSWPSNWFDFSWDIRPVAFQLDLIGALKWSLIGPIFALLFVDLFDTLGTMMACAQEAKLIKKDGSVEKARPMLLVDAIATMFSGVMGTSPTTSYVESAAGIAEGGRTGMTSIVTGLLFLLGLLFVPLIGMVPAYATAPALIVVGVLMIRQIQRINFDKYEDAFPAVITIATMVFTFQISTGLALGFLSWGLIRLFLWRTKEIPPIVYLIMLLSLLSLVL
ncbi:MAG: NCS2 family permease [Bacteroidota bacterium]